MNKYWENFVKTGRIYDYLNYIACTRDENMEDYESTAKGTEEGGFSAGIDGRDGDGTVSHADW